MAALAGAFAGRGKGLGETKEERREAAEIAEIKALGAVPKWADASLLADLRRLSSAEASVTLAAAPVDIRQSIMNSKAIARLPSVEDGTNWAVLCKPIGQQECVICLGQDDGGKIQGAIGWWPVRKGDVALRAADAVRCVLLDDSEHPSVTIPHPTVQGVGENHTTPAPATSDLSAPVPLQLAETMRQFHVSRAQVNARLQRGGASADEKHHVSQDAPAGVARSARLVQRGGRAPPRGPSPVRECCAGAAQVVPAARVGEPVQLLRAAPFGC